MTARGAAVRELVRQVFASIDTLPTDEQETITSAIVAHLRSSRPESVSPLGTLHPTEPIPTTPPGAP